MSRWPANRNFQGATFTVKTTPCPRCGSHRTEAAYVTEGEVLVMRSCSSCRWAWDVTAELRDEFGGKSEGQMER